MRRSLQNKYIFFFRSLLIKKSYIKTNYRKKNIHKETMKFKYVPVPDPLPTLAYIGNEDTMRLACMTVVNGDITVESKPDMNLFGENFFS